jgi:hypothetical protein
MPSENWITLTDSHGTSSAGASQKRFIRQWGHGRLGLVETVGTSRHDFLPLLEWKDGYSRSVDFPFFGTSNQCEVPETIMVRLLCHALLQRLSDKGLPEAVESLADMVEFYQNPPRPYRVLPQGESVTGQWGETRVRPVYPVKEED